MIQSTAYVLLVCISIASTLTTTVHGLNFGVCYDPFHDMDKMNNIGPDQVFRDDLAKIKNDFKAVRTYQAVVRHGGKVVEIGPYIADVGLKASLGIDPSKDVEEQIQAALNAVRDSRDYVKNIYVGNENLMGNNGNAAKQNLDIINRLKAELGDDKKDVNIGTVQRPNELLLLHGEIPYIDELINACDIVGVNIYPFFTNYGSTGSHNGVEILRNQWWQVRNRWPGKRIALTETGWPSGGGWNEYGNNGELGQAQKYFHVFREKFFTREYPGSKLPETDVYYFQYADTPYRNERFEDSFGLNWWNGYDKFHYH